MDFDSFVHGMMTAVYNVMQISNQISN